MIRFIIRRSLGAVAVLIVVSFITFVIFQLAPFLSHSSPVYYYVGKIPFRPGSLQLKLLEHRFGFDLPCSQCQGYTTLFRSLERVALALAARHLLRPDAERRRGSARVLPRAVPGLLVP